MTMKHYLLTWYGMTDLRAALALDATDGPVLNALKTGDYTDVVILAYTDPGKTGSSAGAAPPSSVLTRDGAQRATDAVSNTPAGHNLFAAWLTKSLAAGGLTARVRVVPQVLTHLNDAAGIHNAASTAVRMALSDPSEKQITTYVSPGTPVMAYTWALIARSNPQLRLRVISSSDPRRPPEEIALPTSLLNPSIGGAGSIGATASDYDLVIHLLGEQVMPIFFALRQFAAKRHVILTTRGYLDEVDRLAKVTAVEPDPVVIADPFKPADTKKAITALVASMSDGARVAVNMTGGTKLMFAGALSACWELGLDPFYFEIKNHNVIFLRDGTQVPFVGISDVEDFLRAGDYHAVTAGHWPTQNDSIKNRRLPATEELWRRRDALRSLYKERSFLEFSNKYDRHYPRHERDDLEFSFAWGGGETSLNQGGNPTLTLKGTRLAIPKRDFFPFIAGGWLEEYVYSLLRPLVEEGVVRDVRVGFEVGHRQDTSAKHETLAQEFDCTFTDGKRLWIVECKAGPVKQEAIQKLENNLRQYGGIAARGIIVSSFQLTDANQSRIDSIPTITGTNPDRLTTDTLRLIIKAAQ